MPTTSCLLESDVEKKLRYGPYRKDWKIRPDTCGLVSECPVLHNLPWDRCVECFPQCGMHFAGCLFSTNFRVNIYSTEQSEYDYWLIAENCKQYHGE